MSPYICPVCGYNQLKSPPEDFTICPSCGTEFEYHDAVRSHAELRQRWIDSGAKWHSKFLSPPPNWNYITQLAEAGHIHPRFAVSRTDNKNIKAASNRIKYFIGSSVPKISIQLGVSGVKASLDPAVVAISTAAVTRK